MNTKNIENANEITKKISEDFETLKNSVIIFQPDFEFLKKLREKNDNSTDGKN